MRLSAPGFLLACAFATIAALGVRPGHYSAQEYYASPADNYRTYPVYAAGREPEGYWQHLQHAKPELVAIAHPDESLRKRCQLMQTIGSKLLEALLPSPPRDA